MIRTDKLAGVIAEKGHTKADVAKAIGVTPDTFYRKMKIGIFGSDEIDAMIDFLDIQHPCEIFFVRQ